jgi:pimeloyl-ACP methyl ester carboxylesterase
MSRSAAPVEKSFIALNGARQGMFIASRRADTPILLYLHGGMPEYFLTVRHPTGLEELFTVVWWEQRGSGISFDPRAPAGAATVEQLVDDTIALSEHLRARFARERIYLMAHSGGTFLGIQAAARAGHLYHAYIGMAQISDQLESEMRAHRYMLDQFRARGDTRMVRRLERCPVSRETGTPLAYLRVRDLAMHRLGVGTMRQMRSVISGVFIPSLRSPDYTLAEKMRLWRAKLNAGPSIVWDAMISTDLRRRVPALSVPTYFLHGVHDYTCSYPLARDYLDRLEAPLKGFYTFDHSAHSPIFEEPAKVQAIMRDDVLRGTTMLSDSTAHE